MLQAAKKVHSLLESSHADLKDKLSINTFPQGTPKYSHVSCKDMCNVHPKAGFKV